MKLGDRIREARENRGLTQPELAEKLGLKSVKSIHNLESGRSLPSISTAAKIEAVLGIPASEMTGVRSGGAKKSRASGGPQSAREAVLDGTHYLQYLLKRAGYITPAEQAKAAAALDARVKWEIASPPLVDLWLENYLAESPPPRTSRKRGRGVGGGQ